MNETAFMEDQTQQMPAPPQAAPASPPPVQGKHTHASIWLLGILFVVALITLVAASIYFVRTNSTLMRDAAVAEQERSDALAMLEEKEQEAMELAQELEDAEIPEDAFIAYGGLITPHERETFDTQTEFSGGQSTYLGSVLNEWDEVEASVDACIWANQINETIDPYSPNPELWADEEFLARMRQELASLSDPDRALSLLASYDAEGKILSSICETSSSVFASFGAVGTGYVGYWEKGEAEYLIFHEFQPINIVGGGGLSVYTEALNGNTIVVSGYGDAGRFAVEYYVLDVATMASTMVQSCMGGTDWEYVDENPDSERYDFECELEYIPLEIARGEDEAMMEEDDGTMMIDEDGEEMMEEMEEEMEEHMDEMMEEGDGAMMIDEDGDEVMEEDGEMMEN